MGEPGWPELAACTASMHSVRIVLMASFSMAALSLATVKPVFMNNLLQRPTHFDPIARCFSNSRHVSLPMKQNLWPSHSRVVAATWLGDQT
jgi:hypothetical protein